MIKNGNKYTDPRSQDLQLILRKHGVFFITCRAKGLSISTDNYNNTQAAKLWQAIRANLSVANIL